MSGPNDPIRETLDEIESDKLQKFWSEILLDIVPEASRKLHELQFGTGHVSYKVREEPYGDESFEEGDGVLVIQASLDVPWDEFDVVEEGE